ncbi:MAG: pilus (MSHA type) biogenesis protein MshL [Ectothiorhodospiraceae bacterium]|jgi:MSHA biogenesis protein MshL
MQQTLQQAGVDSRPAGHQASAERKEKKPPESVARELLPPLELAPAKAEPAESRFDVDVQDAPADAFFSSLVKGTPYNIVVHPTVKGRISLSLKDVTIPDVMSVVREVYGYDYKRTGRTYVILPRQLRSRIFHVDYLNLRRRGRSSTVVSSGEISQKVENGNGDSTSTSDSTGSSDNRNTREVFGTSLSSTTDADLWKELEIGLRAIVGKGEGRNVVVSPQSSMVVVRAMPDELREVEAFLANAQKSLDRQVILEAKILEVELSDGFQSGINWAALGRPGDGQVILGSQTGGGTVFDGGVSDIQGQNGNLNPDNLSQVNNTLTSAFGGVFSAALSLNDFTAFIELLQSQGDVQVLSSPRVATVNNQKAVIKVGSDEFFATDVSSTTVTGNTTTTTPSIELTPFFSGIALDVTPQISEKGEVVLHIHPAISQVTDQRKEFTIAGEVQSIPLALSTVRESDSIVRAESGQIVVIGGLMQEKTEDRQASVPLLGDLPVVGGLFRHTKKSTTKTELVILLKPVVVNNAGDWSETLRSSSDRLRRLMPDSGEPASRQ